MMERNSAFTDANVAEQELTAAGHFALQADQTCGRREVVDLPCLLAVDQQLGRLADDDQPEVVPVARLDQVGASDRSLVFLDVAHEVLAEIDLVPLGPGRLSGGRHRADENARVVMSPF